MFQAFRFVVICGLVSSCTSLRPELHLYNSRDAEVSTFSMVTNLAIDTQDCQPDEMRATRICVMSGIWMFYPEPFFHPPGEDVAIYTRLESDVNGTCRNLPDWLDRKVGSCRFAGDSEDVEKSTLNLYGKTYYRENELKIPDSAFELPFSFNSLIRVGTERWQFYMKENYEGFSECLEEDEYFVPDFSSRFDISPGNIKSIRVGCDK